jgi:hypothetical protein
MTRSLSGAVAAALTMLLLCSDGSQAQTRRTAQAQQDRTTPCALVCVPPARLNADKCTCDGATEPPPPPCALVCPDPDAPRDPLACRCLTK